MPSAREVFISYANPDSSVAKRVCHVLESAGIFCWLAPRDEPPGGNWSQAIVDALDAARVMVLILSNDANTSQFVAKEVGLAADRNLAVIPFRIADVQATGPLAFHLNTSHWLDAWRPPFDEHLASLVAAVRNRLAETEPKRVRDKPDSPVATAPRRLLVRAFVVNLFLFALVGFVLLEVDLGGFTSITQSFSQDFIDQVLASSYPGEAREKMAVLLLDDAALKAENEPWPARYGFHARVLESLLLFRPKAVFVDLLFNDPRDDPTLVALQDVLREYRRENIPVYLALSATDVSTGIRSELRDLARPVPVPKAGDPYDQQHREYALLAGASDARKGTAALQMYADQLTPPPSEGELCMSFEDTMHIVWATTADVGDVVCRRPPSSAISALVARLFGGIDAWKTDCPYPRTLFVDALSEDGPASLAGKIVLYGASLVGTHDSVYPPTHTRLPGVYLQAMVLDNLLTFGSRYVRQPHPGTAAGRRAMMLDWAVLALYGILFGLVDIAGEWRRWRLTPHQAVRYRWGAWRRLADIVLLAIGLFCSLALAYTALHALRLASPNWAGCFALAMFLMLFKSWFRSEG